MHGFDHATILSPIFHGPRKACLAQWPAFCDPKNDKKFPGGGYFQKKWERVCSTLPETLTLFQTKICDFRYPISDLERGAWPERLTSCYVTYAVVGLDIKREMVLSPNDEEVANSSKKHTLFQTKMAKKTYPLAWHIPIALNYKGLPPPFPPGRKTCCRLWVSLLTQARLIILQVIHLWWSQ